MEKITMALIALMVIIGIGLVIGAGFLLIPKKQYTGHPESITTGTSPFEVSGLLFIAEDQDEAGKIVEKRLGSDDAFIKWIRPETRLALSLDLSLIIAMGDGARWMIKNNLTDKKEVPVFPDYLNRDGLDAVRPAAANIIRWDGCL